MQFAIHFTCHEQTPFHLAHDIHAFISHGRIDKPMRNLLFTYLRLLIIFYQCTCMPKDTVQRAHLSNRTIVEEFSWFCSWSCLCRPCLCKKLGENNTMPSSKLMEWFVLKGVIEVEWLASPREVVLDWWKNSWPLRFNVLWAWFGYSHALCKQQLCGHAENQISQVLWFLLLPSMASSKSCQSTL